MKHSLYGHDLLALADWTDTELTDVLESAAELKQRQRRNKPHALLAGRSLAMIFEKPSTRTRVGFEVAMTQLGGHAVYLSPRDTQLGRGETTADTARVLSRMCDAIMARVYDHQTLVDLAAAADVPVINGLSDWLHPVQALADLLTIREHFGSWRGLKLAYLGDSNNVSNSLLEVASRMGMDFALGTPTPEAVDPALLAATQAQAARSGTKLLITNSPHEAARDADVLYTDVWTSMGQESDPGHLAALQPFQINAELLEVARPGCKVLHCLPMHRGEEITADVADGPRSIVFDQAENRLHTHKAVLLATMAGLALKRSQRLAA
ncbi:MAG TPA: ornithine carbamoyltransferase [Herpetosiphonaceae bacterium]|nr:ornithine carbamoyltransferase [Herpetosiphonaceae bacterium]